MVVSEEAAEQVGAVVLELARGPVARACLRRPGDRHAALHRTTRSRFAPATGAPAGLQHRTHVGQRGLADGQRTTPPSGWLPVAGCARAIATRATPWRYQPGRRPTTDATARGHLLLGSPAHGLWLVRACRKCPYIMGVCMARLSSTHHQLQDIFEQCVGGRDDLSAAWYACWCRGGWPPPRRIDARRPGTPGWPGSTPRLRLGAGPTARLVAHVGKRSGHRFTGALRAAGDQAHCGAQREIAEEVAVVAGTVGVRPTPKVSPAMPINHLAPSRCTKASCPACE